MLVKAQPYGNEWIDFYQQYYKIKIYEEGIYRISYNTLVAAGVPLNTFDPRSFQIFHNGVEQYLYVHNQNSGIFSQNDYIEFYANKNDGSFDTYLYNTPGSQTNPYFSLFNDTATYFLTWNGLLFNKRYTLETESTFAPYAPSPYFYNVVHQNYTSSYFVGETNSSGSTDAEYSVGEGWLDSGTVLGGTFTKSIQTPSIYTSGPQATLSLMVVSASSPQHHLRITMPGHQIDSIFYGYRNLFFTRQIPPTLLNISDNQFTIASIDDINSNADKLTLAYIQIKYPHTFNLNNQTSYKMYVPDGTQSYAYLYMTNFNVNTNDSVLLFDLSNHKIVKVVKNGPNLQSLVPNSGGEKLCYLTSSGQVKNVTSIIPVSYDINNYAKFTNYNLAPYVNSDYLIVTHNSLLTEVENYKNYRQLTGYNVLVADIDDLYDQFAYGINKHPLSIRNFARFAYENFNVQPKFLFLIGKTLDAVSYRKNTTNYAFSLVPTMGIPCSDNLFTSRLLDTLYQPAIPTGRLAAQNTNHVSLYLNKVIEYEMQQQSAQQNPPLWMKNVLHFGGGGNFSEQENIAFNLNKYKNIIQDTLFGGSVTSFFKTSTAPIQVNQSDSLKDIINNGVSLMTFFGHASGTGFDQSIDNPSEYNNFGKYPFLFANSCYAGDIFTYSLSSSEAFVLIENRGVIGYLASTAPSPLQALQLYANEFYENIAYHNYGKPIGKCIQKTIYDVQNLNAGNVFVKEVCLVSILHGDPAIKLNYFDKPDYEVTTSSIFYTPAYVSTEVDSFTVNVISTNKGMAVSGDFVVELKRTYPNGSTTDTYLEQVPATLYKDTISFKLPVDKSLGIGVNTISVTLDLYNEYDEITKINNTVNVNLVIKSTDIIPIYPHKYAVVPNPDITLKASSGDPFLAQMNYIFEIDTTDTFNSLFLKTHAVTHTGGVVSWTLPFTLMDSTVYYWRVSLDVPLKNWRESSFQYIPNKNGWGQAHYFQFKENAYQYVTYNRPDRNYIFVNNYKVLQVQTGIYPFLAWNEHWYKLNNSVMDIWSCLWDYGNGMKIAVFNPVSGEPWMSHDMGGGIGQFGNEHCKAYDVPAFDYWTHDIIWRNKMKGLIDTVPDGYYILAYNHKNHYAQNYEEGLYQSFESFGSASIRVVQNNQPYIIFGKKGDPMGYANEVIGSVPQQKINLTDSIKTSWNEGFVKSEIIGPASKWNSLHWRYNYMEGVPTDSVRLAIIGVKLSGQQDTILSGISADSLDINNLYTFINAEDYPYLQLIAFMKDDSMHTPAQMNRWHVLYEGVPETALNPSAHFYFHKDTLTQGDILKFSCAIQNIGNYDMDSLLVAYWIVDKDRNIIPIDYPRQKAHPVGDVFIDTITYDTKYLSGLNSFWVEVNPNFDQIEQNSINNIGELSFYVQQDKTNPLLDVTFNGVHILDGDIVSADPTIQVTLRDDNKFIAVDDTGSFRIYLKKPGMGTPERIYFKRNGAWLIRFYPATLPENICRLEYPPGLLPDGVYELSVQAKDASQNVSGYYDYKISFKVINKSTITEVLNYPNPFSTSTRFVFTLTGSQVPTYMKIQIMTITGKIVKEIDISELGNLHIGRNITQYAWDGRDQFGDRLANGVYLYRVIAKMNDKNIELNPTDASRFFTQEFGKMYLFR